MCTFSSLQLALLILSVTFLFIEAQDRIKGPDYMPWIRKTVDLTNHVPKSFRCSYKKRCEEAKLKANGESIGKQIV